MNAREFPSLNKLLEDGINKEIDEEVKVWDERLFTKEPYKGGTFDRFPLSPSQIGKCALALARNVSHYVGRGNYPRNRSTYEPQRQRVFARGHVLEEAMVDDIDKYTPFKLGERQTRLKLFEIGKDPATGEIRYCEGNIDGLAVHEENGVKILIDFKSKGAKYAKGFTDTIQQFFQELRQTGLVQEIYENSFYITDVSKLFDILSLDDFFVDYLLQLNGYAFGMREAGTKVDFVSLFYENKNTSAYYEIRWVPSQKLLDYSQKKYQFIWDAVNTYKIKNDGHDDERLMAAIPKEFALGSTRCFLCEYKSMCYPETLKPGKSDPRSFVQLDPTLDKAVSTAFSDNLIAEKAKESVLVEMERQKASHVKLSNGMVFERRFYKSPKEHFELKQVKP